MLRKALSFHRQKPPLRSRYDSSGSQGAGASANSSKTEKFEKSEQGGSAECNFRYGAAAMQGFRPHMQDDFSCIPAAKLNEGSSLGFFAVFDGHGHHGDVVSQYCTDNFASSLIDRKSLRNARTITGEAMAIALRKTFIKFDTQLREVVTSQKHNSPNENKISFAFSGTTATVALVLKDGFVIGNTGDSRTVLCRSGSLHFETKDHNPGNEIEDRRIIAAGGKIHTTPSKHKVIMDPEAYTNLAVSRTLGDFGFKSVSKLPVEEQVVTPIPDINVIERDMKTDEFLLLASDGIFKALSTSDVVEFVYKKLLVTEDLTKICHELVEMAYFSPGCVPDDTTVILVVFPAAPTPTPKAIREEELLETEGLATIYEEIQNLVSKAEGEWVLDNEFNIIQQLVRALPSKYCVQLRTKYIKQVLSDAKQDRFGVRDIQEQEKRKEEVDGDTSSDVFTPSLEQEQKQPEEEKREAIDAEIPVTGNKTAPGGTSQDDNTTSGGGDGGNITSVTEKQENTDAKSTVDSNGAISSQCVVKDPCDDDTLTTDAPSSSLAPDTVMM